MAFRRARVVNRLRRDIFDEDADGACFEVVARTAGGEAVGRLHCIRNRQDPTLWYYGDLFVVPPIGGAESPC
ncbi:MAG: hypothetical protein ACLUFV_08995 [Acutalibacteraceae bacterium]